MKRRKNKRGRLKLYQGGVVNERPHLNIDDVIPKIEIVGRGRTTRLVDKNDPYNLRGQ
jgi:hypothetical protein